MPADDGLLDGAESARGDQPVCLAEVFWYFLKLGWLAFGGPVGQIGLMHLQVVERRKWLGETTPGPLISIGVFVGFLAGHGVGAGWLGATAATFWLFLPSFVLVLGAAPYMDWLTARPGVKEFLRGVTSGVVGLMLSISIPLARVAFMPGGAIDWITVVLGLLAFAAVTFWKWRLNVVAVVLGGGALGLARAIFPGAFGGPVP